MESETVSAGGQFLYPVLIIPKTCTTLEINCEASSNIFIDLAITSRDTEGNNTCIYAGFCNVQLTDNPETQNQGLNTVCIDGNNNDHVAQVEAGHSNPPYNQSQVWIDPARSPYVYNRCDIAESQEYPVYESHTNHITVEQHNTYITQNVYNYKDIHNSSTSKFEHKKFRKFHNDTSSHNSAGETNTYEDDEVECGVFLSKLPEEIWLDNKTRAQKNMNFAGLQRQEYRSTELQSENNALKQLMSSDIQLLSKQPKTILYVGHNSKSGKTIQKITVNDPNLECTSAEKSDVNKDIDDNMQPRLKKYQCENCKQIFNQISDFKQHMVVSQRSYKPPPAPEASEIKFMCLECNKNFKNQEKFEMHCLGHGNPELECNRCHKVFASKFTLRTHRKLHLRKHSCNYCTMTYTHASDLKVHEAKNHYVFYCDTCSFTANSFELLTEHKTVHGNENKESIVESAISDEDADSDVSGTISLNAEPDAEQDPGSDEQTRQISRANSIIAKVVSNKMFLLNSKKTKQSKKYRNVCDVCEKTFDRIGDLKRHLIEHVIKSTLAKIPVNRHGALNILCEICQAETFSKVDKYKAHLREHAKLTIYKCIFCDKSFSDSSNFSKHKKIHAAMCYQCDLCQRKFNSKKMITQHMKYHLENSPVRCCFCNNAFYFKSMLNKHIKASHMKDTCSRYRCGFCCTYFTNLKSKWDHEWTAHKFRKTIADCQVCGAKYRKYSELKRHCSAIHKIAIPSAKKFLKKRKYDD